MMDVQVSNLDRVTLVQVNGRVDGTNAARLGTALSVQIDSGHTRIVLDLSRVEYISSAGLREIVMAYKRVQRSAGDVRIVQPTRRVMELLEVSGLDAVLQIFPSLSEAVGSY